MSQQNMADYLRPAHHPERNQEDLNYFRSLQEYSFPDSDQYTASRWDRRADFWEAERKNLRKNDERIEDAVDFLTQRGILTPGCSIADIGCGPGRFAAAFAQKACRVVGFDVSPQMVNHGNAYIQRLGLRNAVIHCQDFAKLDIRKEGYEKSFDLVFASMTQAVHQLAALQKAMDMSRGWCLSISGIRRENQLRDRLLQDIFGQKCRSRGEGRHFYALFNILFLMGYEPETSFFRRQKVTRAKPDGEYTAYIMEHTLPLEMHTAENAKKIREWLLHHVEKDGFVTEISNGVYGRILWDVRNRSDRPDYRSLLEGKDGACTSF